jgi:hypothetical protein
MSNIDIILKELGVLQKRGSELLLEKGKPVDHMDLNMRYEPWYTKCLATISVVIPERLDDFRQAYKADKRREINAETYRIHDFIQGVQMSNAYGVPLFDHAINYTARLLSQLAILQAAVHIAPSVLRDMRSVLRAELYDDDLAAAYQLLAANHLRPAGVMCGVVLESHMRDIGQRRQVTFKKKNPGISDMNDDLRNANVYDVPAWRLIQRLSDIRNICAHKKEREPTQSEIDDLLSGTNKCLKEIQ